MSDGVDTVIDGDSSGSESLDAELGIPSVWTPAVQRAQSNAKTQLSDMVICKKSCIWSN